MFKNPLSIQSVYITDYVADNTNKLTNKIDEIIKRTTDNIIHHIRIINLERC